MRIYAIASVFALLVCVHSNASVLTNRLTFDGPAHLTPPVSSQGGGEDLLQDDSVSAFLDLDGSSGFSLGDVIWGVVNMTNTDASGTASQGISQLEQITLVFAAKITGTGSLPGSWSLDAVSDATKDYDLRNILSSSILDDFASGPNDDSLFVIMSNPIGNSETGGINPLNLNANLGGLVDANSVETNITNANGWTGDAVGGILGSDFFEFFGGLTFGTEIGGFSIQEDTFGGIYLPVDVNNLAGAWSGTYDVTLNTGTVRNASTEKATLGWFFEDQGSFFVNALAVPEPISAVVWMGIFCLLFGGRRADRS